MTSLREPSVVANSPCCICGSTSSRVVFDTVFSKFNNFGVFHMRQCDDCGLLFSSPRLTDEGIASLYNSDYYVFHKREEDCFDRTAAIYERTVGALGAMPQHRTRALEVGSGKGYLLAVLKSLGWDVFGIELSEAAARYAEATFGAASHVGTLESYLAANGDLKPFPLVLCIDVIEHVVDPVSFVDGLSRVTEAGGYVVIDTPNGGARHIEIEKDNWRGFNPFHIYLFNSSNIKTLLGRHGLNVVEVFSYNNALNRNRSRLKFGVLDYLLGCKGAGRASSLEECVEACSASRGFAVTPDAAGELAEGQRGENLIIVAQKS